MAPPLALGEVPEEVRMNKLLGMNAPPAAKVYNEKERYHVEWKDLHMSQEEQDRIAYLRERGAKHVFTPYELEVRALRSRDLEAYKKPTPLTQQFDRECKYDFKQEGLSFDPRQAPSVGGIFNLDTSTSGRRDRHLRSPVHRAQGINKTKLLQQVFRLVVLLLHMLLLS